MSRAKVRNARIVLVTCPSLALARKIARAVVEKRLAACVNVVRSPVESFYTWKGRLESAREHLLLIKTRTRSEAPAHLRGPRIHRPTDYRGLARMPGLAGRNDSGALQRNLERATVELKGESNQRIEQVGF